MAIDLDKLSESELKSLRSRVERALNSLEKRRFDEARRAAEDAARAHGFSLAQVVQAEPARRGRKRASGPAQFANPADPGQTWTGRGRQPEWMKAHLAAGGSRDDLRI